MAPSVSNAGITTDETSGERHIPSSTRADGSTRKAIRVRPGYRPPEDVELYRARNAVARRERNREAGVPGASTISTIPPPTSSRPIPRESTPKQSGAQSANWRQRTDRTEPTKQIGVDKDAKTPAKGDTPKTLDTKSDTKETVTEVTKDPVVDPEVEREKKARNLKKKLKQAKELQTKKENGEGLLPEQIAKVIKINELVRELSLLGFSEGDTAPPKDEGTNKPETK
ncbi:hypothetical protein VHEMI01864 [[Torrubiella] hemipterigena]|uniref:WIBG Mago-binding domain-containing protein n=1 Tax=[Torrubiella] hemipterigena TaxID=1531966 RepID=A0A0A1SU65_9HYPO|nr:hypothetical protein VHEMI01864 [[Torrubiella] hemipterigena]